jgi:YYY domain-containing protein
MSWIWTTFSWYLMLLFMGIIFVPITKRIFGRFFIDFGYPFAKIIALLAISYTLFIFGLLKIIPFTQTAIFLLLAIFFLLNLYLLNKNQTGKKSKFGWGLIIFEEILFLASLYFWTFVRGQEPSIRGLEKFMDFGFINSILKSVHFPPLDMWLSADAGNPNGFPINYYYFGHLCGAVLIKLLGIKPSIGYNLILATIFAFGVTEVFSLSINLIYLYLEQAKKSLKKNLAYYLRLIFFGLLGTFIVNLGGNLHTIYVFTTGYPNDNPIPFWKILGSYNPLKYWYPNATRFIPFTIHEFPSYSYVVADLHGHVFDIPFVLLTIALVLLLFLIFKNNQKIRLLSFNQYLVWTIAVGFMLAVHYMTNAFDGPIYILLAGLVLFLLFKISWAFLFYFLVLIFSFLTFTLPFSLTFSPFVSGIGVNCSPTFLTNLGKLGPFLFEKGNCQPDPLWMLWVLWGFFWINFILFLIIRFFKYLKTNQNMEKIDLFIMVLFAFGTFLIIIPEFFYIKDIYPAHFRANTMFKLGYQAFIMMGIASLFTIFKIKLLGKIKSFFMTLGFILVFFFISIYPFFSIPSYYGNLNRPVDLDGSTWLTLNFPEDKEIIDYLNDNIKGQPVILEAQGDSYTDYERISAYTGLPTVAGWWVHEWLWRGSPEIVGQRIPDINAIYESTSLLETKQLLKKYHVEYVVISSLEKQKYSNLNQEKFSQIGRLILKSSNGVGALYQIK